MLVLLYNLCNLDVFLTQFLTVIDISLFEIKLLSINLLHRQGGKNKFRTPLISVKDTY